MKIDYILLDGTLEARRKNVMVVKKHNALHPGLIY